MYSNIIYYHILFSNTYTFFFFKKISLNYKVNKMANASSLNLSELLLPSIQLFKNNQDGDSIRYENCQFNMKRKGKQAAYFECMRLVFI
jgi:hypothetical protein